MTNTPQLPPDGDGSAPPSTVPAESRRAAREAPAAVEASASAMSARTGPAGEVPATPAPAVAPVLDEGVYTTLREPKASGALALDGVWHQISPKYVVSQVLQNLLFLAGLVVVVFVLVYGFRQQWAWIPGGVLALITLITLVILPRQARAIGYMLRGDDIVFRKGILWQRMIAVPYGRMQLVDITHGPLDRAFGVAKLKMVTAAATTGVEIPGMNQVAAEALRDTLIEVAETRRTGL